MAFVVTSPLPGASRSPAPRGRVCRVRPRAQATPPPKGPMPSEEPARKKLTRNLPVEGGPVEFARPAAGEAGGPQVGEGLGPRTPTEQKKVTKAARAQGSMGFADAWASQNRDRGGSRFDVWFWIGLSFILTPPVIIVWAILTGVIPGFTSPYG